MRLKEEEQNKALSGGGIILVKRQSVAWRQWKQFMHSCAAFESMQQRSVRVATCKHMT